MLQGYETKKDPEALWTLDQVINYLSISKLTAYRMIKRGDLKVIKIGKRFRVPESEIKRLSGEIQDTLKTRPLK